MSRACLIAIFVLSAATWGCHADPVTIGGVTYDRVDPGDPFTAAPEPPQDWSAPAPTVAERAAGMMAYIAPDPGQYRPYRIPRPEERTDRLRLFLTPGEEEPLTFAVYSLADLSRLSVTADVTGAPVTVDIRHEHCWPQRTGWSSRQWYTTPELLLPCAGGMKSVPAQRGVLQEVPFDLGASRTQGLWLTFTAASDAAPGLYRGTVTVTAQGREPLRLPLEVEILPFTLRRPTDRFWTLYADVSRWSAMNDQQVLAELGDFRRHGMDGLIEISLGTPDLSRLREGKVTYDASAFRRYAALGHQVGMDGPHVIGSPGAYAVRDALGLTTDLNRGDWPAEVTAGVTAVARAAVEATADLPVSWYYYGVDEPTGENTYAIQDYQAWHAGGAPTYATFYVPSFLEKASAFLTAPCFVVGLISAEESAREAREACEKTGAEFWWYGTGSYVNPFPQEGYEWHNRYGAGLLFWKSGARTEATWTFCRPHEDVFNDFDGSAWNGAEPKEQCTVYPHFLRPDDWSTYQGAIPTLAWEGLREGVDDYKYLHTLTELIKQAQASPLEAARAAAAEAQATLDDLVEGVPWANPMGGVGFEARQLQQLRRVVADRIITLQGALEGRAAASPAREQRFSLKVTTSEAPRRAPLPVLGITSATSAPQVDGVLSDACWRAAAVAGDFTDINDGSPSRLATTARVTADDQALYVAFDCPEPAMDRVVAKATDHDGTVWLEDGVELFVAGASRVPYAHLILTTANVLLDERNQSIADWNPAVRTAVARGKNAWTAEIALPWSELAAAGIEREPMMALNLGRSRYTGGAGQTHTAWSCTYSGFHVPARFGLATFGSQALSLCDLRLPDRWGEGAVGVTLANTSAAAVTGRVAVRGWGGRTVSLAPGARAQVSLPVTFRRPGERRLTLSWGPDGQPGSSVTVPVEIPEPFSLGLAPGLAREGATLALPVTVGLSPASAARHALRFAVASECGELSREVAPRAGQRLSLPVRASGRARLQVSLVDAAGRPVGEPVSRSLVVLPD